MNYQVDRTEQLSEAVKKGYRSLATQLRAAGTPTRQHNVDASAPSKTAAKKSTAKKSSAKKAAKKS